LSAPTCHDCWKFEAVLDEMWTTPVTVNPPETTTESSGHGAV
jgi:hypothetical protein